MKSLAFSALFLVTYALLGCNGGTLGSGLLGSDPHLSAAKAQNAVNQGLSVASQQLRFHPGYSATVEGIQEDLPSNSATGDLAFHGVVFVCDFGFAKDEQDWFRGVAKFKHYSDGRWVLSEIIPTQQRDNLDCLSHWEGSVDVK